MVCGKLRPVSKAEEAGKGRELSPTLPRQCATQEGTRHDVTPLISSLCQVQEDISDEGVI